MKPDKDYEPQYLTLFDLCFMAALFLSVGLFGYVIYRGSSSQADIRQQRHELYLREHANDATGKVLQVHTGRFSGVVLQGDRTRFYATVPRDKLPIIGDVWSLKATADGVELDGLLKPAAQLQPLAIKP